MHDRSRSTPKGKAMMVWILFAVASCGAPQRPPASVHRPAAPASDALAVAATAERFVQLLFSSDDLAAVTPLFDPTIAERNSRERLHGMRGSILGSMGLYRGREAGEVTPTGDGGHTIRVLLAFERNSLEARVELNAAGRITGFSFLPAGRTVQWQPPAYAEAGTFSERATEVQTPGEPSLEGSLSLPTGGDRFPAVVLLHGAGPGNRDAGFGGTLPFRDLAHGLASRGIVVLRYDKRSFAHPDRFAGKVYTVEEEILADSRTALALLRSVPEVDSTAIFLLGHSMGGMLAPRVAEGDPRLAGLILLGAPTRPLPDVIGEQIRDLADRDTSQMPPAQLEALEAELARIRSLTAAAGGDSARILGAPAEYARQAGHVSAEVVEEVAAWIYRQQGRAP